MGAATKAPTPLPIKPLVGVFLMNLVLGFQINVIWPFLPFMVDWLRGTKEDSALCKSSRRKQCQVNPPLLTTHMGLCCRMACVCCRRGHPHLQLLLDAVHQQLRLGLARHEAGHAALPHARARGR